MDSVNWSTSKAKLMKGKFMEPVEKKIFKTEELPINHVDNGHVAHDVINTWTLTREFELPQKLSNAVGINRTNDRARSSYHHKTTTTRIQRWMDEWMAISARSKIGPW